ncbi:MAG: hypothetical protein COV07_02695 [Candidatus Vogelbacteria bacterium CG10_big_fil_rev_8_21_14_0_10_45_14]|uniref:6-phosphogluconate dehydrogenase NADP-binding domain-containing protein n=1 Tax=Candidatus Vogelbacteria bacterium CG10_big_fil_rev_8_21_14_0_10_45_14 TaxID=1975042 RepID=A0A2H0RJM7_9BACT|nr:MAG: hypothetical protein COV07_02695 [Candidatus Vogelbacteria bacterium CG10_big_fil_rev_8_21_14_0_10_45_14]
MKSIAIIGTGIMGSGMASNFLKKGHSVNIWNRNKSKTDHLVNQGALLASTPKEAVTHADIIFEVTADNESSRSVWLGENGILSGARSDKVLITSATLSATWTDELAKMCADKGFTFLDIPLTGGRACAESGNLTLLAGGEKEKLGKIESDLRSISKEIKYFGKAGSGMRYKLILNALQAIHIIGLDGAIRGAISTGLDVDPVGEALCARPGGVITELTWECYKNPPKSINFSIKWLVKDLTYAKELLGETSTPMLDMVLKRFNKAFSDGHGEEDWSFVVGRE